MKNIIILFCLILIISGCGGGGNEPSPPKTFNISMIDTWSVSMGIEEKTYKTAEKYYRPIIEDSAKPYIYAVDLSGQIITSVVQWVLTDTSFGTLSNDGLSADCMFNSSGNKLGKTSIKAVLTDGSSDTAQLIICPAYLESSLWSGQGFVFNEFNWMSTETIGAGAKRSDVSQSDIYFYTDKVWFKNGYVRTSFDASPDYFSDITSATIDPSNKEMNYTGMANIVVTKTDSGRLVAVLFEAKNYFCWAFLN